jgi:hypothetical protein
MIDFEKERLVSFAAAAKILPPGRGGKKLHVATVHRWAADENDPLEWIVMGGIKMTSIEALQRFIERRTAAKNPNAYNGPIRTPRQREAAIRRAEKELEEAGI